MKGVTANKDEINLLDGATAGTVVADKAVIVVGSNKDISGVRNINATGTITADTSIVVGGVTNSASIASLDNITMDNHLVEK